jgi:hypothetical protein
MKISFVMGMLSGIYLTIMVMYLYVGFYRGQPIREAVIEFIKCIFWPLLFIKNELFDEAD